MAKPIVARWEWRTFGAGFGEPEAEDTHIRAGELQGER